MDPERKRSNDLIEAVTASLPSARWGYHLIPVVADYIADDDLVYALKVLRKIPAVYFEAELYDDALEYKAFREAVCRIIDAFGLGFALIARDAPSA